MTASMLTNAKRIFAVQPKIRSASIAPVVINVSAKRATSCIKKVSRFSLGLGLCVGGS